MSTGAEWTDWEGTQRDPENDWKIADHVGKVGRFQMRVLKTVTLKDGSDADLIEATISMVEADGKTVTTWDDAAIWGAWFINTFRSHLPYTAYGRVVEVKTDKGFRMRKLEALTEEERKAADAVLDQPDF